MAKPWRTDISVKGFFPNTKEQYINTNVTIHFVCITHDNSLVHKARSIQKWLVEIGVEELENLTQMWEALESTWASVPVEHLRHLVESMP
jgi:hypothetical protein